MKLEYKPDLPVSEVGQLPLVHDRNILVIDTHFPGIGITQGTDDLKQGRFACPTGPYDGVKLPGRNFQIDSLQDLKFAKGFLYLLDLYQSMK